MITFAKNLSPTSTAAAEIEERSCLIENLLSDTPAEEVGHKVLTYWQQLKIH